jgi:small subunit ribosomal protein S25e
MGGNKKKPAQSNTNKSQDTKNVKKDDVKKPAAAKPQQKQKLSVLIEENQGLKVIDSMKAITIQGVARNLGVKISVANNFIKNLENKKIVRSIGGNSGHKIYQKIRS